MRNKSFAVFILTFGRASNIKTVKTLRESGYTGPIYFIVSDDDPTIQEYIALYGKENVFIFNKDEISKEFDVMDNFKEQRAVVYARNYNFKLAKKLGIKYFWQLDDDYTKFYYRLSDYLGEYTCKKILNLDKVLDLCIDYLSKSKLDCLAFAQGGDYIGGDGNGFEASIIKKRKIMNSFLCDSDRPFQFLGKLNEDVNTYVYYQSLGKVFLTFPYLMLDQLTTQANQGGLTDIYLSFGTYVKSFYTVILAPSSTTIELMRSKNPRLHHKIEWPCAVPMIIREEFKK